MICHEFPTRAEDPFWPEGLPEATHQYTLQGVTKSAYTSIAPHCAEAKFKLLRLDGRDEPSFAHQTGDNTPGILLLVVAYRNTANITASRLQGTDAM